MPAAIAEEDRSAIVYYAALGYAQADIAEEVGVSRNTVRKYLRKTRAVVEESDDPQATLVAVIQGEYDWARPRSRTFSFGDHPM